MYENKTEESLRNEMLGDIDSSISKDEGYLVYDAIAPPAKQFSKYYSSLDTILKLVFGQEATELDASVYDSYVDLYAEVHGVKRTIGDYAIGFVTFSGTNETIIPENSLVQTKAGLIFKTIEPGKIVNGICRIPIKAIKIGSEYNVPINTIIATPIAINGVTSITNEELIEGGTDTETSSELLARANERIKNPPSSGNKDDYKRWSKEVSGVKYVNVKPLWAGKGTVKVIIAGENGCTLDDIIVKNVKEYLDPEEYEGKGEGKSPIGATVTVVSVNNYKVNIKIIGLSIINGNDIVIVKENITKSLNAYFEKLEIGSVVKIKTIEALIVTTTGVNDISALQINGDVKNIILTDEDKATLGDLIYE